MSRRKRPIPEHSYQQLQQAYPMIQAPAPVSFPFAPPVHQTPTVFVQTLQAKNASVANVTVSKPGDSWENPARWEFKSDGSAKREQGDRFDPETGEMLAVGRALVEAGEKMVREANKRVQASIEQQAAERQRAVERRNNKTRPVRHRTLAEWEAVKVHREEVLRKAERLMNNPEEGVKLAPGDESFEKMQRSQVGQSVVRRQYEDITDTPTVPDLEAALAKEEKNTPYWRGRHAKS
jgi:hypothetical protein